jgi:pyruvate carboxylase subunit B
MELNEGIKLLTGKGKIDIPLKKKEAPAAVVPPIAAGPHTSTCQVEEGGKVRTFVVTLEPAQPVAEEMAPGQARAGAAAGTPVYSGFGGEVEVVDIKVKVGDSVEKGKVVATVEAMKAQHDIKAPRAGMVSAINARIGEEIDASDCILTIS